MARLAPVLTFATVVVALLAGGAQTASAAAPTCKTVNATVRIDMVSTVLPDCGLVFGDPAAAGAVYSVTSAPSHGSVRVAQDMVSGTFRYLPRDGFTGDDAFSYRVTTANGVSNEAQVQLHVSLSANRPPSCGVWPASGAKVPASKTRFFEVTCDDAEGDSVTLSLLTPSQHAYNGAFFDAGRTPRVSVIPEAGFLGADALTVRARDSRGLSVDIPVTYTVVPDAPNAAPVCSAVPAGPTRNEPSSIGVLCQDADGEPVEARVTVPPAHGTMSAVSPVKGDMFLSHAGLYTPDVGYTGPDSVTIVGRDERGADSAPAVVSFTVAAPVAVAPVCDVIPITTQSVRSGTTRTIPNVCLQYGGFSAPEITDPPNHGVVSIDDGQFLYRPDAGYTGPDAFSYRVLSTGGTGPEKTQPVSVSTAANTPPSCGVSLPGRTGDWSADPVVRGGEHASVRATCNDIDGDRVDLSIEDPSHGGPVGLAPAATLMPGESAATTSAVTGVYTPDAGYAGFDELVLHADDGHGGVVTQRLSLLVRSSVMFNSPPSCGTGSVSGALVVVAGGEAEYSEQCRDAEGDRISLNLYDVPGNLSIPPAANDEDGIIRGRIRAQAGVTGIFGFTMRPVDQWTSIGPRFMRRLTVIAPPAPVDLDLGRGESAGAGAVELPTAADPAQLRLTTLNEGRVKITRRSGSSPDGYAAFGLTFDVTAPDAIPEVPLRLRFRFDTSIVPAGTDLSRITVFRNGAAVPPCTGAGATPDPCVAARKLLPGGDGEILVFSSKASAWSFGNAVTPATDPGLGSVFPGGGAASPGDVRVEGGTTRDSGGTAPGVRPPVLGAIALPKLRAALTKGLQVKLTSAYAGTARAKLTLDGKTAKRLRLSKGKPVAVATGTASAQAGRPTTITLRFTKAAKRALGKAKKSTFTLQAGVNDGPVATKKVTLKR